MKDLALEYRIGNASVEDIYSHLKSCNNSFIPALDTKVDLKEYSTKIKAKAHTFEIWENKTLVGLIAGYFNDPANKTAFITNVSLVKVLTGKGLAQELMSKAIAYAKENNFKEIVLEVSVQNKQAVKLYQKNGFVELQKKGDTITMKLNLSK